ncbi:radical SAM protein, partial [Bartonella taylorii]
MLENPIPQLLFTHPSLQKRYIILMCYINKKEGLSLTYRMLKEKGAASVMLSGGEPLMHPKLKDILLTLNELGLPVELNTNGILLHKNLWISQYDIKEIVISMDSTSVQGYYDIRGANKFDRVWKNI